MLKKVSLCIVGLSILALAACSPVKVPSPNLYSLSPMIPVKAKKQQRHKTLLVLATQTAPELNAQKMMYVTKNHQLGYFTENEWAAPPAKMLTPIIADAIQKSRLYQAVVTPPFTGASNIELATRLTKLQQNFIRNPSVVEMTVSAQLINTTTGKVLAENIFNAKVTAPQNNPYAGVIAANKATNLILQKLVAFARLAS